MPGQYPCIISSNGFVTCTILQNRVFCNQTGEDEYGEFESGYSGRRTRHAYAAGHKGNSKEMLPIVDKPMIQYIVDEIVAAGIKEIALVTHSSKNAVENHFDTSYELEALLEQRVKRQLLAEVQAICPPGVTIMNVRQAQPLGLGHSILCARPVVGDNPFVVVLPDIILDGGTADPLRYNLAAMIARFNETGRSQVLAKRMPGDLSEYSVIQTKEPMVAEGQVARIVEVY